MKLSRTISDPGGRAAGARHRTEIERLVRLRGAEWQVKFYRRNPIVIAVLVGETEAMIAFPADDTARNLESALFISDPLAVAALRTWYDHHVWHAQGEEAGVPIGTVAEYDAMLERDVQNEAMRTSVLTAARDGIRRVLRR